MGSPISSTVAEIYLQFLEETHTEQWSKSREVVYYKRYVDDILIIFDQNRTNEQAIINQANSIDKHLQFRMSTEENKLTNYLDLSIHRNDNNIDMDSTENPYALILPYISLPTIHMNKK